MIRWLVCLNFMVSSVACQTTEKPPFCPQASPWDGKVYMGDSKRLGVARSPLLPVTECKDPQFDKMICMTSDDFQSLITHFEDLTCAPE